MKRTKIEKLPFEVPDELAKFVTGATVYDSSCSPEARVYFIDKDGGYYLKKGGHCSLETEAAMTDYFHKKGLGPEVLFYRMCDGGVDLLLTSRVVGEDCTHAEYLANPKRLTDTIAKRLRALHEMDFSDCPLTWRTEQYIHTVERNYRTGNYDKSAFPDSFGYATPDDAYAVFKSGKDSLLGEVLIHGDYCLPNIILDSWRFSGFIDLGNSGVGDRHIDLFWGAWTLKYNLGTDDYRERFFDAYGRDKIIEEKLKIVAAAEAFG